MYCICASEMCHFRLMVTAAESNAQNLTDNEAPTEEVSRIMLLLADLCVP